MYAIMKNRDLIIASIIVIIALAVGSVSPGFLDLENLISIYDDMSILMILALGQMIVIITRCIDLSVAANVALTGMILALINSTHPEIPIYILIMLSIVIGAILGLINGFFVWNHGDG